MFVKLWSHGIWINFVGLFGLWVPLVVVVFSPWGFGGTGLSVCSRVRVLSKVVFRLVMVDLLCFIFVWWCLVCAVLRLCGLVLDNVW